MVANSKLQLAEAAVGAKTDVDNARTSYRISEAELAAVQARQSEAEGEPQRQATLARTGRRSGIWVELAQPATPEPQDLRASFEQVELKSEGHRDGGSRTRHGGAAPGVWWATAPRGRRHASRTFVLATDDHREGDRVTFRS
jgi:hypothetical protein